MPPETAERDVVMNEKFMIIDDGMERMERVFRVFDLVFGYSIAAMDAPAKTFTVKGIAKNKRIVTRKIISFSSLFEAFREGCGTKEK